MEPTSMNLPGRPGGSADCDRPDLAARMHDGEELSGGFGKEIELHSRNCAACSLRLSLLRQAETWMADQGSSNRGTPPSSSPCPSAEELYDFGQGPGAEELPLVHRRRVEAHLVECADCRGLVATLAQRPPAPLLDRAAEPDPRPAPQPLRLLPQAGSVRRARGPRRNWLAYAAAAAVLLGAAYLWNSGRSPLGAERGELAQLTADKSFEFPELPVLRGESAMALHYPSGRVLAAAPDSAQSRISGTWFTPCFEIAPQPQAQQYRIELSRAPQAAFGKPERIADSSSAQPSFELLAERLQPLAPGEYSWEAWALVNGLEQPLGRRSFEVVLDAAALEQLRTFDAMAEPARSNAALGWLVAHEYFSDARAWARSLPASPQRDEFLSQFPGR